jgi:hypothetical protein
MALGSHVVKYDGFYKDILNIFLFNLLFPSKQAVLGLGKRAEQFVFP